MLHLYLVKTVSYLIQSTPQVPLYAVTNVFFNWQRQKMCRLHMIDRGPPESCAASPWAPLWVFAAWGATKLVKKTDNAGGQAVYEIPSKNNGRKLWAILWKRCLLYFINIIRSNHYLCSARRESTVLCWHHIRSSSLLRQAMGRLDRRATVLLR